MKMTWQVIEYMDNNPQATPRDVLLHFAREMEIDQQLKYLKDEVDQVLAFREQLKPLYAQKSDLEKSLLVMKSNFEMEVMAIYPPRKGTDKDRKAYMTKLQAEDANFTETEATLQEVKEKIQSLDERMQDFQTYAKNARRILETFNHQFAFLTNSVVRTHTPSEVPRESNANVF